MLYSACQKRLLFLFLVALVATAVSGLIHAAEDDAPEISRLRGLLEKNRFDEVLEEIRTLLQESRNPPEKEAALLDLMVETAWKAGHFDSREAREAAGRAIDLKTRLHGPEHASVAVTLTQLGILLSRAGELAEAAEVQSRAVAVREKALGPDHADVAVSLDNLGDVQQKIPEYEAAAASYGRALKILEAHPQGAERKLANLLNDMGNLGIRTGNYAAARERYERALEIYLRVLDPDHRDIATTRITLGYLFQLTGDLQAARSHLETALSTTERTLGPEHPLTGHALLNLGNVYYHLDEFQEAEKLYRRTLELRVKSLGPVHVQVADAELNLGAALRGQEKNEEALPHYERAMKIYKEKLGESHPRVAELLVNIGNTWMDRNKPEEAASRYEQSLAIRLAAVGSSHPDTARSHEMLAGARLALGDRAGALEHATAASLILDRHTRETIAVLPEREALLMVAGVEKPEALLFKGLLSEGEDSEAWLRACWEWALRRRGLVLEELARRQRRGLSGEGESMSAAWNEVAEARKAIGEIWSGGSGEDPKAFESALAGARARKERAEIRLGRLSSRFEMERRAENAGLAEVRAALPKDGALVEFVRVETGLPTDEERPSRDVALILRGDGKMEFADLSPARDLDGAISSWRTSLESSAEMAVKGAGTAEVWRALVAGSGSLREILWNPVQGHLHGVRQLFIVPDGPVHAVDFYSLPVDGDRFLIDTGLNVHYLDSGRDLVRFMQHDRPASPAGRGVLALGSPDFEAKGTAIVAALAGAPGGTVTRGAKVPCKSLSERHWPDLPESALEVEHIKSLFGKEGSVRLLTGAEASEDRFRSEAPGREVIHLATHGFFMEEGCGTGEAAVSPLLLSGLVFAGANQGAEPGADRQDGYLTAEEMAGMDLRGVSLAVLSACETGRGRSVPGEGLMGLRRALAMSGVRTVLMSLWRVPDRTSRRWMTSFYGARSEGRPIGEAVRTAASSSLDRLRDRGRPPHPYFWSGFVAAGDWR